MTTVTVPADFFQGKAANDTKLGVGTPGLYTIGSDRYAGTVTGLRRGGRQVVWTSDSGRIVHTFNKCADGEFRTKGGHGHLSIGDNRPTRLDMQF
jgi:hypothetical protein